MKLAAFGGSNSNLLLTAEKVSLKVDGARALDRSSFGSSLVSSFFWLTACLKMLWLLFTADDCFIADFLGRLPDEKSVFIGLASFLKSSNSEDDAFMVMDVGGGGRRRNRAVFGLFIDDKIKYRTFIFFLIG